MNQNVPISPPCRSVFLGNAAATTTEKYTTLWITLINQMEQAKKVLAGAR